MSAAGQMTWRVRASPPARSSPAPARRGLAGAARAGRCRGVRRKMPKIDLIRHSECIRVSLSKGSVYRKAIENGLTRIHANPGRTPGSWAPSAAPPTPDAAAKLRPAVEQGLWAGEHPQQFQQKGRTLPAQTG